MFNLSTLRWQHDVVKDDNNTWNALPFVGDEGARTRNFNFRVHSRHSAQRPVITFSPHTSLGSWLKRTPGTFFKSTGQASTHGYH